MGVIVESRADESGAYRTSTIRVPGCPRWHQQGRTLHLGTLLLWRSSSLNWYTWAA
jgi:hypothetical protein